MSATRRHNPNQYRSGLEQRVAEHLEKKGIDYEFEPKEKKIEYIVPAKRSLYLPDFYIKTKSGKTIIIETKGIWVYEDRYKHLLIRQSSPELDIRFVFSNSRAKIRKNSKTTYADVCNGEGRGYFKGVTWKYADKLIPEEWLNE